MNAKKLLVADDSLTIQKVIRLALSSEGYEIQTVSDGSEALQQISLFRPDVVLIDVALPSQNAFEIKHAVNEQKEFSHIKFVLMMSAFEKLDEAQSTSLEFHGRLTKPFDPAHLRQVISDVLSVGSGQSVKTVTLKTPPPPPPGKTRTIQAPSTIRSAARTVSPVTPPPFSPLKAVSPPSVPEIKLEPPQAFDGIESIEIDGPELIEILPEGSSEAPVRIDLPGDRSFQNADFTVELEEPKTAAKSGVTTPAEGSDIRQLTASTLNMSGLDDFDWQIDESSKKKQNPGEPQALQDTSEFPFDPNQSAFSQDPAHAYHSAPEDSAQITSPSDLPQLQPRTRSAPTLDDHQIEAMVAKKVEAAIEKLAQKILPDVAERVIKQEIRKLLEL